jgi:DNA polymerase-3 subunit gamma/tau
MSYQVLARKWRPQTFSELVGQQHVVDAITNALVNDKLHHAYLFTGTRGVGKTTIARIFSKSLNCEQGQSANPCGQCSTCKDISDGRYVDLLEIDAASRTKVEDTRELLDNVQYRPTRGKYKVYLIDEVHMLSKHSFNALLKTLEEPPEHVKFLLATTDPQKLPVTVLSRCLQFSLKALSIEQIQGHLSHILEQEKIPCEASAIAQIARAAQGSIRDSLSLTDQAIAQGNNQVSLAVVANMLGLLNKNLILKLVKHICERDNVNAINQLDDICSQSPDYFQVLSQLLGLLHQIALTQVVPEVCKLDSDSAKGIYTLANSVSKEQVQILYQIGVNGKRDLPHAPDARTGLQMTILRMLAFSPVQKIDLDVDSLVKNDPDLPAFESLPEPKVAPAVTRSASPEVNAVIEVDAETKSIELSGAEVSQNPEAGNIPHASVPEQVTEELQPTGDTDLPPTDVYDDSNFTEPTHFRDEQAPMLDEEPPMFDDMFGEEPEHMQAPESKREQESQSTSKSTYDLLQVSKDLKQYTQEKEGDSGVKKPEADTQTATAVAPEFAYQLGYEFQPFSGSLSAFLEGGEKLVKSAQLDAWSAFIDATGIQALTRQLLIHANCAKLVNPLVISILEEHKHLCEEASVEKIESTLSDLFGQIFEVNIEFGQTQNTPFQIQSSINEMRMAHALQLIGSETSIQELVKAFDAKVIDSSVEAR